MYTPWIQQVDETKPPSIPWDPVWNKKEEISILLSKSSIEKYQDRKKARDGLRSES